LKRPANLDEKQLTSAIDAFSQKKNLKQLEVEFDLIRPGVFVGQRDCSDGTVVAMASEAGDKAIVALSKELASELAEQFPQYFPTARQRPLAGVWCSLGYFDEPDFQVDGPLLKAFIPLKGFKAKVTICDLAVTEFALKSLADSVIQDRPLFHSRLSCPLRCSG
jgi:hypothetical protein